MKKHLRTILVFGLTIPLLVWFLWGADLGHVWDEIRGGSVALLLLALCATMTTYALRAYRWQYLLGALGPTHFATAFRTTVIGFAASFLLPARAGEVVRPYLLARRENLKATSTFATIILERLLDLVTVLVLFAVFLLVFDPSTGHVDSDVFAKVRAGGVIAGIVALVSLSIIFVLTGRQAALGRAGTAIERLLPGRIGRAIATGVQTFVEGMIAVRQPGRLAMTFILSFPLWLSIASGIFFVTRAYHIGIPFTGSFLVMAILAVGVAVPTPGAVGGFHLAYQIAVVSFYGVGKERADGAAIVLHAISFLPVTMLGIIFMAREGLSLGRVRTLASGAAQEEGTP